MCLFLAFHLRLVCMCTVCTSVWTSGSSWYFHPATNLPYITAGTTWSTNLLSVLQCEQVLPQRNEMSLMARLHYSLCIKCFLWTLSAPPLSLLLAWWRCLSSVKTVPCKQWEAAIIVVPLDLTSMEAGKQLS